MATTPSPHLGIPTDRATSRPRHDRPWLDLATAAAAAVVMLNVHVSSRGDALSSLERSERRGFYAMLAISALVLLAGTLARQLPDARWCRGCLGFAAASGTAAMLLDVQDGPIRTVQLAALLGLFLAVTATIRVILAPDDRSRPSQPR